MEGNDITGIILAGGKSNRYGKNKAFELVDGIPIIERIIRVLKEVFSDIIIITNSKEEYRQFNLRLYEDIIKGLGPIGGIYTGLKNIDCRGGFFVACDMPFLNAAFIRYMISIWNDEDVVVPRFGWKIEPLHAIYSKACIPYIEELIKREIYQIRSIFNKTKVRYVQEEEITQFDPSFSFILNINRPEDLDYINKNKPVSGQ